MTHFIFDNLLRMVTVTICDFLWIHKGQVCNIHDTSTQECLLLYPSIV